MIDLSIDRLQLSVTDAAGQEHRLRPIARRAVALLTERLSEERVVGARGAGLARLDGLRVPPVALDLRLMSDEQAADAVSRALLAALRFALRP